MGSELLDVGSVAPKDVLNEGQVVILKNPGQQLKLLLKTPMPAVCSEAGELR